MASSHNANMPGFYGGIPRFNLWDTSGTRIVSPPTIKQDEGVDGNIRGIRLLFVYCFVCQIFSTYRAYEIYQDFDSWVGLNRKDRFFFAWGVVSAVIMAFFTAAYAVLEYWRRQMGRKDKV